MPRCSGFRCGVGSAGSGYCKIPNTAAAKELEERLAKIHADRAAFDAKMVGAFQAAPVEPTLSAVRTRLSQAAPVEPTLAITRNGPQAAPVEPTLSAVRTRLSQAAPVEPNPPSPLSVAGPGSSSTTMTSAHGNRSAAANWQRR